MLDIGQIILAIGLMFLMFVADISLAITCSCVWVEGFGQRI
ncbi:hypothetical protein Lpp46_1143 [Lacticaseibacillus paracasei subsp. paracasei Lpp46]|nr:hypothetical protein Lpp46_1143 [Lacticaseibacillus paracasei subsp. paracasei Lpp46]